MASLIVKFPNNEEYARLKKDAHAHEMTVSEYVRWLIKKERTNPKDKIHSALHRLLDEPAYQHDGEDFFCGVSASIQTFLENME